MVFLFTGFLVAHMVKCLPAMWDTRVQSLGREDPWRRKWQPTPVFLPGEPHGQWSLVGCCQWGCKESGLSDLTFTFHFPVYCLLFIFWKGSFQRELPFYSFSKRVQPNTRSSLVQNSNPLNFSTYFKLKIRSIKNCILVAHYQSIKIKTQCYRKSCGIYLLHHS